jgi:hypothetical protein
VPRRVARRHRRGREGGRRQGWAEKVGHPDSSNLHAIAQPTQHARGARAPQKKDEGVRGPECAGGGLSPSGCVRGGSEDDGEGWDFERGRERRRGGSLFPLAPLAAPRPSPQPPPASSSLARGRHLGHDAQVQALQAQCVPSPTHQLLDSTSCCLARSFSAAAALPLLPAGPLTAARPWARAYRVMQLLDRERRPVRATIAPAIAPPPSILLPRFLTLPPFPNPLPRSLHLQDQV